ncbi:PocR ligand-binding domain-containing protein [Paludicola sp. MB14-C6]|uniref:helix-turn-helix domain-containing protein n=1 Tax=Paludihabitans sp. MB14-C6 TaxID=3070656 RepID=UPI0027DB4012|nr:helix-turn-helix domain-containing protein [Paludicola sp. MB14-C6]WMJ22787.1 PocR ligand-binding domain-containing protein [Paludicola sp. MB14-C6]
MSFNQTDCFNLEMAQECISAFSEATGLGTAIVGFDGECYATYGFSCENCKVKNLVHQTTKNAIECDDVHLYGMLQAQRFGGKYIYFCPAGFNFIISPIMSTEGAVAYAKAGPFLMVDQEDYIKYDLLDLLKIPQSKIENIVNLLEPVPYMAPEKVTKLSTLLFMSIGFVNNIKICNDMLKTKNSDEIQGHIGDMLRSLKAQYVEEDVAYPFEKENELISAIIDGNKAEANQLLNDLLGYIFFYSGGKFEVIRARVFELLVLLSRAAVEGGADAEHIFTLNCGYFEEINHLKSIDELCLWLVEIMNNLTDYVFRFTDVKHVDIIRKSVDYIRRNFAKKITLEDVASYVFLSPSYFSKVFKDEMEMNFNAYLNKVRIDKSKQLLMNENIRLVDVSGLVGFEDQSYFSKVFKKLTGVTPGKYKESRGKIKN